jgi:hypothetical protein
MSSNIENGIQIELPPWSDNDVEIEFEAPPWWRPGQGNLARPPDAAFNARPEPSPPGRCAWCDQVEAPGAVVIPFGAKPRTRTWLHTECWPAWIQAQKAQAEEALPDLQGIVECSSGYDRITSEVWAEYDKAAANYRLAKIVNLHDEQAQNRSGGKTAPPATRK